METLAQIYMLTGRFAETQASTRRQLELNPSNVAALLNAGLTHIRLKNYPEAVVLMDRLLGIVPNHTGGLFNRGIAELLTGNLDAATVLADVPIETPIGRLFSQPVADDAEAVKILFGADLNGDHTIPPNQIGEVQIVGQSGLAAWDLSLIHISEPTRPY